MAGYNLNGVAGMGLTGVNAKNYAFMNGSGSVGSSSYVSGVFGDYANSWQFGGVGTNSSVFGKNTATTAQETKDYVSGIKEASGKLVEAANSLTNRFPPLFKQLTDVLDNQNALDVTEINSVVSDTSKTSDVNIKQIAEGQKNVGDRIESGAKTLPTGNNSFEITKDGKSFSFDVNIQKGDNNLTAQIRVADAINKKDTGLYAFVSYDDKTKESFLTIQSNDTGEKQNFGIKDTNGGSLISQLGADKTETQAKDALYSVNGGVDIKSASNNVYLGNGVNATLKEAGKVKVGVKTDSGKIMDAVKDLVSGYNKLMSTAKSYASTGSDKIVSQLTNALKNNGTRLAGVGITAAKDGSLVMDQEKMKTSIENGSMEKALTSGGYSGMGFANAVKNAAKSVNSSPNQYIGVQKSGQGNQPFNGFYGNNLFGSITGLGLLFNGLF